MIQIIYALTFLLWQAATPSPSPAQNPNQAKLILESLGIILTPVAAIGFLVGLIYFFWHGKNREELTKALAETKQLAETRKETISDLRLEFAELEKELATSQAEVKRLELEDEKRAKTEFRLRAEILELEMKLGIIHDTSS